MIVAICPNPVSSKAIDLAFKVHGIAVQLGIKAEVYHKQWPERLSHFKQAWVVGGDGTMNYFINQYPDAALPLTIFKAGTGNDFHWSLYGDINPHQQIQEAIQGNTRSIDAGLCNGRLFINGLGIGFDGAICQSLQGKTKLPGKLSYLGSALRLLGSYKEQHGTVSTANNKSAHHFFMITVANGKRLGSGFLVAPNAVLDDGALDIVVIEKISVFKRFRYMPWILKGKHLDLKFVIERRSNTVEITMENMVDAHADGEYFQSNRFYITTLPGKFSFLV